MFNWLPPRPAAIPLTAWPVKQQQLPLGLPMCCTQQQQQQKQQQHAAAAATNDQFLGHSSCLSSCLLYNLFILSFFSCANRQITTTTTIVAKSSGSSSNSNMMTHSLDLLGKLANGKCSALSKVGRTLVGMRSGGGGAVKSGRRKLENGKAARPDREAQKRKEIALETATETEIKEGQALNPCHSDFDSWPNFSCFTKKKKENRGNGMMSDNSRKSNALYKKEMVRR